VHDNHSAQWNDQKDPESKWNLGGREHWWDTYNKVDYESASGLVCGLRPEV
jgi:hypothetical protein